MVGVTPMTHQMLAHCFPVVMFAGFGVWLIFPMRYYGRVEQMACGLGDSERIAAAKERRQQAEGTPPAVEAL